MPLTRELPLLKLLPLVALALASCSDGEVEFPNDIAPLEANRASFPPAEGADEHPEKLGTDVFENEDFETVHGKGYIHAPIAKVWEALQDADTVVDRRRVNEWKATRDVVAGAQVSFRVHNTVRDLATVEYDTTWRAGIVDGEASAIEVASARASVPENFYMSHLEDSVVLRRIDGAVTAVELLRQIKTLKATGVDAELYLRDLHASLAAKSRGEALPTY